MNALAKMKLEITNGRVVHAEVMPDGICELTIEITKMENSSENTVGIFTKQDDPDFDWK